MNINDLLLKYKKEVEILKKNVSIKKYMHSINVATRAMELACIYNLDIEKAFLAGLLHDICKEFSLDKMLTYLKVAFNNDEINYVENYPEALHAYSAVGFLISELKIDDKLILNAIKNHTLGLDLTNDFSKVIYISDLSSIDREFHEAKIIYEYALKDLKKATAFTYISSIIYVMNDNIKDEKLNKQFNYWKGVLEMNKLVDLVVETLEDIKVSNIAVFDFNNSNPYFDAFVVGTVNERQAEGVVARFKKVEGLVIKHTENAKGWLLIDLGDCIVHLFNEENREYYDFDGRFASLKIG